MSKVGQDEPRDHAVSARRAMLEAVRKGGAAKAAAGPSAARSQDFLYEDDNGLIVVDTRSKT